MKKRFIFFIFLLGFLLFPHETFAAQQNVGANWTAFKQRSNDFRRPNNMPYGYDTGLHDCVGLGKWSGCLIPGVDSNLFQYYAIRSVDVCLNTPVTANKLYNVDLQWWGDDSIKISDANFSVGFNNSTHTSNGSISMTSYNQWYLSDNHTWRLSTKLTFVPNTSSNSYCFGIGDFSSNSTIFALNANVAQQNVLLAYAYIEESGSGTDIGPLVNQQIATNNKLDEANDKLDRNNQTQEETNDKLDSIGDDLVDDTAPSSSDIGSFKNDLPALSFGPISQLLQAPIQVLNYSIDTLNNYECRRIDFGDLLGTTLYLPCFNPMDYFDSVTYLGDIWVFIGVVSSIFIYYQTIMLVVNAWDTWTSFDDGFNSLYQPKHANNGYKPKHGGGE